MKHRRFTNTALPVFSGAECWFQHFHIVQAIVKLNGWPEETVALQLFAHLKGEALNVALLLTREKRESWTGLVSGLSACYQSPDRLAVLRRWFESAFRRPGLDPATFATELGILAIQGFEDMKETGSGYDDKRQVHHRSKTVRIASAIGRICTGHSYWGDRG